MKGLVALSILLLGGGACLGDAQQAGEFDVTADVVELTTETGVEWMDDQPSPEEGVLEVEVLPDGNAVWILGDEFVLPNGMEEEFQAVLDELEQTKEALDRENELRVKLEDDIAKLIFQHKERRAAWAEALREVSEVQLLMEDGRQSLEEASEIMEEILAHSAATRAASGGDDHGHTDARLIWFLLTVTLFLLVCLITVIVHKSKVQPTE